VKERERESERKREKERKKEGRIAMEKKLE
jgi:hypothetical protein